MYCSPAYHNDTDGYHSLEELQQAWISLYSQSDARKLKYKIGFSGGEPTVNKNFLPFVKWLRSNYSNNIAKILVTTNGSANLRYYLRLYKYVDNISFSVHSEHIDENKFFDMVTALKNSIEPDKFIHVNIMNEFWNQDRIKQYEKVLNSNNISYNINEIDYSYKTRSIPIFKGKLNLDIQ
jgi:MoaA/NifB/PqqE/SkfB family radical SAM enzyme